MAVTASSPWSRSELPTKHPIGTEATYRAYVALSITSPAQTATGGIRCPLVKLAAFDLAHDRRLGWVAAAADPWSTAVKFEDGARPCLISSTVGRQASNNGDGPQPPALHPRC